MDFTGKTLLTIDDEPALRRGFRAYFEDSGFTVLEAGNGRIGVEIVRDKGPDVVLCDLRMPEMGGLEAIKIIAAEAPDTPLIVVSGTGLLEDATEALRVGAWDYVTKPIADMAEVEHIVNKSLEKAALLAENRHYQARLQSLLRERTQELNKSRNLIETIFTGMPGLMFVYELTPVGDFELVRWNQEFERVLGYSAEELEGTSIFILVHEKHHESIKQRLGLLFNGEPDRRPTEYMVKCKGGEEIPFLVTSHATMFEGKTFIVGFGIDITEKKKAEKELLRLAAAIEQAAEAIVITDSEGVIEYVNPAFEKVSGYSSAEVLGNNPRVLKSGAQDENFYRNLWAEITSGKTWRGRMVNRRKDGSLFSEDVAISPVYDRAGKHMGFVSVKKDVTEQIKLEEHLRQAQKMESIATLAGGIAHDFNNILAAIISSNELAMINSEDNPQVMKNLKRIAAAGSRARDLVQQILTFGRPVRDGKISMQPALVVKEALKLLRASIPTTIEIRTEIEARGTIMGDPTQIHQIVMNLCTNAFHAMRESGGVLGVSLNDVMITENDRVSGLNIAPGNYLLLEISDTGHGMSKEILEKIFEPYFTTKSIGDGTGLGLAVIHGIIESHNGLIKVYSEPGEGTVFRVYFPAAGEAVMGVKSERGQGMLLGNGEHLMVVDDEEQLLELLTEYLTEAGYRVSSYVNGLAAWEAFQKQPAGYDLLLTDMAMPGFDGKELAKKVLQLRPELPVIINTGFSPLLKRNEALAMGVADYLQKPVSINLMLTTIKRVLDEKLFSGGGVS